MPYFHSFYIEKAQKAPSRTQRTTTHNSQEYLLYRANPLKRLIVSSPREKYINKNIYIHTYARRICDQFPCGSFFLRVIIQTRQRKSQARKKKNRKERASTPDVSPNGVKIRQCVSIDEDPKKKKRKKRTRKSVITSPATTRATEIDIRRRQCF